MSAFWERTQRMPNVPLTYISVCERMRTYEHTLAYADAIRCSVTALVHTYINKLLFFLVLYFINVMPRHRVVCCEIVVHKALADPGGRTRRAPPLTAADL